MLSSGAPQGDSTPRLVASESQHTVHINDGESSLLMVLMWWMMAVLVTIAAGLLLLLGCSAVKDFLLCGYRSTNKPTVDDEDCAIAKVEAVVVPGGGLLQSGLPPPWVEESLKLAAHIYNAAKRRPCIITLSSGSPSLSGPLGGRSTKHFDEADVYAKYLVERCKVDSRAVLKEKLSYTLIGNAYFARTMHTDVQHLRHVVVVTNEVHLERVKAVFTKIFSVPPLPVGMDEYKLSFWAVPDVGLPEEDLASMRATEVSALQQFNASKDYFASLDDVHSFILNVHGNLSPRGR